MAQINTLGVDALSIRGAAGEYHRLNRFFRSRAEAEAALASGDYVPQGGVANAVIVAGEGLLIYNESTGAFDTLDTATRTYIDERVGTLLDDLDASDLDSITELANAINNNPNFWSDTNNSITSVANDLVSEISSRTNGDTILTVAKDAILSALGINDGDLNMGVMTSTELDDNLEAKEYIELLAEAARRLREGIGVAQGDSDLGTFTGSTISDNVSIKVALQELETSLEAVDIDTDDLAALTGIAENITHLGGFTGSTIADDVSVKDALQSLETAVEATQADVDQNEADADTAIAAEATRALAAEAAIQADVDQNEADADAAISAEETRALAAEAAIQADVDQNEADADAAIAAEEARALAAEAAIQADVDQNEADADAAIATERARIDAILLSADADKDSFAEIVTLINSVDTANDNAFAAYVLSNDAAVAAVQADVDQNEADADAAIAAENAAMLAAVAVVQADVDQNEADADAAIAALQADVDQNEADADAAIADILDGATFTGDVIIDEGDGPTIKLETSQDGNAGIVLNGGSGTYSYIDTTNGFGNDSLQIYSANTWCRAISGGTGNLIVDGTLTLAGTALTATFAELNFVDGVTSNVQTQLDAIQADVDQNETDGDAADAALSARLDTLEADPTTATAVAAVQADVDQNEADADAAIAVERARIDAILAGADADKDTFAEIVTLINSVDTTNDNAFAAYVLSNDAAVAAVQADVDQNESDADAAIALKLDASAVSAFGLTLVDDADAATARTTLGLGTAATTASTDYATAAQGTTADNALPASSVSAFGLTLVDDADAATARTTLGVDAAGTDNSTDVTIAAGLDYVTISGQELTLGSVDLTADVTGALPLANGGTGATDAAGARTALGLASGATTTISTFGASLVIAPNAAGAQQTLSIDHLITLSGVAESSNDLGTFTGATINDNVTVKAALQALETAQEATQADVDQNESDADAAIAAVLAGTSIPGPYADDAAAASGGVAVGALYKHNNGQIHWRVS